MRALIVDDDDICLDMLQGVLDQMGYQVDRAADGAQALAKLRADQLQLVITDWSMPRMNGIELCQAIRKDEFDRYIYVIMLTSHQGGQEKIEGLHAGADAFLVKPLNPAELIVSLKTADRILSLETRDLAMFALAKLAESRDPETGAHIERVQSYARLLAQYLSTTEAYHNVIDAEYVRLIFQTSPLHDIGKVGIPDSVLLKPGKLTEEEFAIMRTHASLGAQTLDASLKRFPNIRFLQMARDIAQSHHEWWDGSGYPSGLSREQIPLAARIVALADVYDALTSRRVYREAMSHHQARSSILRERGTHFDPDVVDAFVRTEKQFIAIRERFKDDARELVSTPAAAPSPSKAQASEQQLLKALVVDDDPLVRELLVNFLNAQGIESAQAANGVEAMAIIQTSQPRLLIVDWEMPQMDGLELCRQVRARRSAQHVHFIMLTIHSQKDRLCKAFDVGVDDFLAKPFQEGELLARLHTGLRALAIHDELMRRSDGSQQLNEQLMNLNRRLQTLAITDDLTGLFNRRQAMLRLEEHWAMCDRYGKALSVLTIDIDHFKRVNDTYGHGAGDSILRGVADALRECVRTTDIVCRLGGEEFLVILPSQTAQEAEVCAQRSRQAVAARVFDCDGRHLRVTVSVGISTRRADMPQCADLLKEADEALYAAKQAGRDAVRFARGAGGSATAA
ncbi:MAG TPA: response regulator [Tepidisphaeraceae bacterium]|jgi:putative two-component system response regulator